MMRVLKFVLLMIILLASLILTTIASAQIDDEDQIIRNYVSPCGAGTAASVSTFHGINRNGLPPLDPDRRSFDFNCTEDLNVYAVTSGRVFAATPRYGGLMMIDDRVNDVCVVLLHVVTFEVTAGDEIQQKQILGTHRGYNLHHAAVDGWCADAALYDIEARTRERLIIWQDIGERLPVDIPVKEPLEFTPINPPDMVEISQVLSEGN